MKFNVIFQTENVLNFIKLGTPVTTYYVLYYRIVLYN